MQKPARHSTRPELILPGKRMAVITVLGFGVVLLVLTAVDWTLRFSWFRWQDFMVHQQKDVVIAGPDAPLVNRILPEHAGGDLTSLTGLASFNRAFEEVRPETRLRTDEFGYRNDPPTVNRYYPIVVLGDSFMHIGFPSTNVFSARLEEFTGQSVYNYSYPGRGPFWSLSRFLNERRFEDRKPEVLVWGLIERDISGVAFAGMAYQVWKFLEPEDAEKTKPAPDGINWDYLKPAGLKSNLPNTSFLAATSKKIWNRVRYLVFGAVTPDVLVSLPNAQGERTLFYRLAVDAMQWPHDVRDPEKVVWAIDYLDQYCRKVGIKLCIVLIPDKPQVYRALLPPPLDPDQLPPSVLWEIEKGLQEKEIAVVNLLKPYRDLAGETLDLYQRDDTHWKPTAIEIASRLVGGKIHELQQEGGHDEGE